MNFVTRGSLRALDRFFEVFSPFPERYFVAKLEVRQLRLPAKFPKWPLAVQTT